MRKGQRKPCPKRCLNGSTPMTREEKNARRRELDKNPFHHALTRKVKRRWYAEHRDELNAHRRAKYAAMSPEAKAKLLQRQRDYTATHPEKRKAAWRKWAAEHREKLRRRDRERQRDPEFAARKRRLRKIRDLLAKADPAKAEAMRIARRLSAQRRKHCPAAQANYIRNMLVPRWERLMAEGAEGIEKYRRRCTVRTWSLLVKWARERGVYLDPQRGPGRRETRREARNG